MFNKIRCWLISRLIGNIIIMANLHLVNVSVFQSSNKPLFIYNCEFVSGKWSKGLDIPDSELKLTLRPTKGR